MDQKTQDLQQNATPCNTAFSGLCRFPISDFNKVIVTGLLVSKSRNADNADSRRPVLDFEVVFWDQDNNPCIESIPALLSGGPLARSLPGLLLGGVYEIAGYVRCDRQFGLYIETTKLICLAEPPKAGQDINLLASGCLRTRLLEMEMAHNFAVISGIVTDIHYGLLQVEVSRERLTRGDLTSSDQLTVDVLDAAAPQIGDRVICMGQLCSGSIFVNQIAAFSMDQSMIG